MDHKCSKASERISPPPGIDGSTIPMRHFPHDQTGRDITSDNRRVVIPTKSKCEVKQIAFEAAITQRYFPWPNSNKRTDAISERLLKNAILRIHRAQLRTVLQSSYDTFVSRHDSVAMKLDLIWHRLGFVTLCGRRISKFCSLGVEIWNACSYRREYEWLSRTLLTSMLVESPCSLKSHQLQNRGYQTRWT